MTKVKSSPDGSGCCVLGQRSDERIGLKLRRRTSRRILTTSVAKFAERYAITLGRAPASCQLTFRRFASSSTTSLASRTVEIPADAADAERSYGSFAV